MYGKAQFARRIFLAAGIYGLVVITPLFFLEQFVGRNNPPLITHPEFYYGFAGAALAWQVLFLFISRDPVSYRPLMLPSILEKLLYPAATCALRLQHRIDSATFYISLVDGVFLLLFIASYCRTPAANRS